MKNNQKGQLILTLILVMATALVIGLSVIQRSLTDVSTSTKVEQSSRAFSAAEAGIEQYLGSNTNCTPQTCKVEFSDIGSKAAVEGGDLIPCVPGLPECKQPANTRQDPLEFPLLSKEEVAQVWLADPLSEDNPPAVFYNPPTNRNLDIFWGNSSENKAALEATLVYYEGGQYKSQKFYLDHSTAIRNPANNFTPVSCPGRQKPKTSDEYRVKYGDNSYQCKYILTDLPQDLMLIRIRLLYNDAKSQPFAAQATGICSPGCSLPRQARVLTSTGSSGETARKVQLFQSINVVPPYLNYAIFSAREISK